MRSQGCGSGVEGLRSGVKVVWFKVLGFGDEGAAFRVSSACASSSLVLRTNIFDLS